MERRVRDARAWLRGGSGGVPAVPAAAARRARRPPALEAALFPRWTRIALAMCYQHLGLEFRPASGTRVGSLGYQVNESTDQFIHGSS